MVLDPTKFLVLLVFERIYLKKFNLNILLLISKILKKK
jgi:hypothetical protein